MQTLPIDQVDGRLMEILAGLAPGDEVVLTDGGQPLARLVKAGRTSWPCKAGSAKDKVHWMAPDFNAPLDEFKEYMQ